MQEVYCEFHATFSGGVAHFPKQRTTHELIETADQALYRAKQNGRNQVIVG